MKYTFIIAMSFGKPYHSDIKFFAYLIYQRSNIIV